MNDNHLERQVIIKSKTPGNSRMFFYRKKINEMRVFKFFFSFIIFFIVFVSVSAQQTNNTKINKDSLLNKITDIDTRLKEISTKDTTKGFSAPLKIDTAYINQIHEAYLQPLRDKNGLLIVEPDWTPFDNYKSFRDTVIFEPAFLPVVFDGKILPPRLDFIPKDTASTQTEPFYLISPDSTFAPLLKRAEEIEAMRRRYYMNNPQQIRLNAMTFEGASVIKEKVVEQRNPWKELITADNPVELNTPEIEKIRIKPVYWLKNGSHKLDLSQNSFSDNWSGENNFNIYSEHKVNLNYKKDKIYFNNLLEWRLSIQQMKADTVNKVNILDDLFRTYSSFGVNAFKNWSYSSNLEMKTPLFNRYNVNDASKVRQRAFLSPFELNLGVGMRYAKEIVSKADKYRKFNITADISVLSLNYKYVRSDKVKEVWFGIDEGDKAKTEYGSTYNLNVSYSRNRYTNFTSRLKYFTNYERVYVEFENSVNFKLNSYFSTSLYLYVKYDDNIPYDRKDSKWGYFSYYQRVGFGLYYSW